MESGEHAYATILALKYKDYYDKDLSFAWLTRDDGESGCVFRMRN